MKYFFKRTEVKTFLVEPICSQCKTGTLIYDKSNLHLALMSNPPRYTHKCSNETCNHEQMFYETYPKIDYVIIQPESQNP